MEIRTIAEGSYLSLYESGTWEFTARPSSTGVVGILPVTEAGPLINFKIHACICLAREHGGIGQ